MDDLQEYLDLAIESISRWESKWGRYDRHNSLEVNRDDLEQALRRYLGRLEGNYPFFHPRYAGQMLKPPHPVAVIGYLAAMLINPNNHALDGGPPTSHMEKEVMSRLAQLFGCEGDFLGHLTSSGTIANLEALWIARERNPDKAIAYSWDAHYTHERMCSVLRVDGRPIQTNERGEMDLGSLERELETGEVGAVIVTAGTTGFGIVDDIPGIIDLCRRDQALVHVDAAYGGFFRLLCQSESLSTETSRRLEAIRECDSVVVDPHKHGLQPYGCGAVLFRDPAVGRFYRHDSPYTYFTSDDLHLGEISLECSRAGAAAGALWLTLDLLPLEQERGFGPILAATRRAAEVLAGHFRRSEILDLYRDPILDIVTYFPSASSASEIDWRTSHLFQSLMDDPDDAIFLSMVKVKASTLPGNVEQDVEIVRILRSVLMKPEHEQAVPHLASRLKEELARLGTSETA